MHTFKKEERLCNKRLIDGLFHNGSSFLCYPYKVSWLLNSEPQPAPVQVLFSVSKKRFKRAVDRNLIKRHMRESYRVHKQQLLYDILQGSGKKLVLSLSYIAKEIPAHALMEKKMQKLLTQLCDQINK